MFYVLEIVLVIGVIGLFVIIKVKKQEHLKLHLIKTYFNFFNSMLPDKSIESFTSLLLFSIIVINSTSFNFALFFNKLKDL